MWNWLAESACTYGMARGTYLVIMFSAYGAGMMVAYQFCKETKKRTS